ncbi:TonB-dependent receptor [Sphingomonas sp. C8-2]|nr:TonB-dependent receptor [Sphingomonas sp. C8-2]
MDRLDLTAGVNYQFAGAAEPATYYVADLSAVHAFPVVTQATIQQTEQTHRTRAAFVNVEWHAADQFSLSGGLRYTKATHRLIDSCFRDAGDGTSAGALAFISASLRAARGAAPRPELFVPGGCVTLDDEQLPVLTNERFSENNLSWRVNASWKPDSDMLFYANASRGYKSGSYISTAVFVASVYKNPVRQERNMAYELGAKLSLLDRRLQLNGALFYYDLKDKQLLGTYRDIVIS